jgi:hypothetical protein
LSDLSSKCYKFIQKYQRPLAKYERIFKLYYEYENIEKHFEKNTKIY